MKKIITFLLLVIALSTQIKAQQIPSPTIPKQTVPQKKIYEKPQIRKQIILPVEPKQMAIPGFKTIITTAVWKGQLLWNDAVAGYSDGITNMQFNNDKTVSWAKQGLEVVSATLGTYNIIDNSITISFMYAPYSYSFQGNYNITTGEITGSFTQVNAPFANASANYKEGTITGTFKLIKK